MEQKTTALANKYVAKLSVKKILNVIVYSIFVAYKTIGYLYTPIKFI